MLQAHLDPTTFSLEESFRKTAWTPRYREVRRSAAIESARGEWQRNLYMTHFFMKDIAGWPSFLHRHVLSEALGERDRALVKNRFPYALQNSEHYVLWTRTHELSREDITNWIRTQLPQKDFVWYKNPKPTMISSVSEHYHVFVKK